MPLRATSSATKDPRSSGRTIPKPLIHGPQLVHPKRRKASTAAAALALPSSTKAQLSRKPSHLTSSSLSISHHLLHISPPSPSSSIVSFHPYPHRSGLPLLVHPSGFWYSFSHSELRNVLGPCASPPSSYLSPKSYSTLNSLRAHTAVFCFCTRVFRYVASIVQSRTNLRLHWGPINFSIGSES